MTSFCGAHHAHRTSRESARGVPLALTGSCRARWPRRARSSRAPKTLGYGSARHDARATQAPFFTKKDALLAGAFVVATAFMFPLDKHVGRRLQDPSTQANQLLKHASTGVEIIASPGAYIIGGALYAVGRIGKWDRVADLGWHGTEAVLFAQGVTYVLKGRRRVAVGRFCPTARSGRLSPWQGLQSGRLDVVPVGAHEHGVRGGSGGDERNDALVADARCGSSDR